MKDQWLLYCLYHLTFPSPFLMMIIIDVNRDEDNND